MGPRGQDRKLTDFPFSVFLTFFVSSGDGSIAAGGILQGRKQHFTLFIYIYIHPITGTKCRMTKGLRNKMSKDKTSEGTKHLRDKRS